MEILGIHVSGFLIVVLGFCALFAGFWLVERSKWKQKNNRHKSWHPDVDDRKVEMMSNHVPGRK